MSDDNNIVNNQSEKLAKVSQVTPRKATSFFSTPVFKTISGLIIIFMILGYLGKGSDTQARETGDSFTQSNDQTLKQNLAKLSAMKSAEKAVKEEHEQQKIRAILAARNKPNYTSTPDGKKIGNPAAYRSKPKVIKSGRKLEKLSLIHI